MGTIRCYVIEPTDRVRQELRRYNPAVWDDGTQRGVRSGGDCPAHPDGYHNAQVRIEEAPLRLDEHGYVENGALEETPPHDDPRWPTQCACGYAFTEADVWQLWTEHVYRRVDTGADTTLRDAPAGAMYRAPWYTRLAGAAPDGDPLCVKTPAGQWCIDECATDCPYYSRPTERPAGHHCWTRQGTPPDVTAAPSIHFPGLYHGWLKAGELTDA